MTSPSTAGTDTATTRMRSRALLSFDPSKPSVRRFENSAVPKKYDPKSATYHDAEIFAMVDFDVSKSVQSMIPAVKKKGDGDDYKMHVPAHILFASPHPRDVICSARYFRNLSFERQRIEHDVIPKYTPAERRIFKKNKDVLAAKRRAFVNGFISYEDCNKDDWFLRSSLSVDDSPAQSEDSAEESVPGASTVRVVRCKRYNKRKQPQRPACSKETTPKQKTPKKRKYPRHDGSDDDETDGKEEDDISNDDHDSSPSLRNLQKEIRDLREQAESTNAKLDAAHAKLDAIIFERREMR